MPEKQIIHGRGNAAMFDEYMDFINYVFGFNGNQSDFKKLLPKLYRPEYDPAGHSSVTTVDGKIKAAVGAFDHDLVVCGERLRVRGIGNVAVHPYERSHGYMKELMKLAVNDMIAEGVDMSALGGRRQRYRYFSFDKVGSKIGMSFNDDNIRHTFGKDFKPCFSFRKIKPEDADVLAAVKKLAESQKLYGVRETERYYDILVSWEYSAYAAFFKDEFAGYCLMKDSSVSEMLICDPFLPWTPEFIRDLFVFNGKGKLSVALPFHLSNYIEMIFDIAEYYDVGPAKSFSIFNYKKVIGAFLRLRASCVSLPDGELTVNIEGIAKEERLRISVKDGFPSVEDTDAEPDLELSHIEAMDLFFAPYRPERDRLPAPVRTWLPLPLFVYSADTV